jgi:hypothetical protein
LKSYLQVSTGDLKTVLDRISLLLINQTADYASILETARQRTPHDVNIPVLAELIRKVTPFALRKILAQYQRLSTLPLPHCTTGFRKSMGLPCAHDIQERHRQGGNIHLSDVHVHWHFTRPDPTASTDSVQLGPLLVHEPAVVKPKGRPRGSKNKRVPASSTRRELSSFELPSHPSRKTHGQQNKS